MSRGCHPDEGPREAHQSRYRSGRRSAQELGQVGPRRRDRHAQLHDARRHRARRRLVRKGQVFSLALNYDNKGPQGGKTKFPPVGRFNPVHTMLRTGTDAYSGVLDKRGIRSADDIVLFPLQGGTHWDGLGHIFYGDHMWNGYDCRSCRRSAPPRPASRRPRRR